MVELKRGDTDDSADTNQDQQRTNETSMRDEELIESLASQAYDACREGQPDKALALYRRLEEICRQSGDELGSASAFGNQGNILHEKGDLDGAIALHEKAEHIFRGLEHMEGLSASLCNQAGIVYERGDLDKALSLYKEAELISRTSQNEDYQQRCLLGQGVILKQRGDLDGAMSLYKQAEDLCRRLGKRDDLSRALGNEARILAMRGDLEGALALHREEECICKEIGDKHGLSVSLGNQALVIKALGDLDEALQKLEEQEGICREVGDGRGLADCLGVKAGVLHHLGDTDAALSLHEEEESIHRELGNMLDLWKPLFCEAQLLLYERDDPYGALPKCEEAIRILTETGMAPDVLESARRLLRQIGTRIPSPVDSGDDQAVPAGQDGWIADDGNAGNVDGQAVVENVHNDVVYLRNFLGRGNWSYGMEQWYDSWIAVSDKRRREKIRDSLMYTCTEKDYLPSLAVHTRDVVHLFLKDTKTYVAPAIGALDALGQTMFLCGFFQAAFEMFNFCMALGENHDRSTEDRMYDCTSTIGRNFLRLRGTEQENWARDKLDISMSDAKGLIKELVQNCTSLSCCADALVDIDKMSEDYIHNPF